MKRFRTVLATLAVMAVGVSAAPAMAAGDDGSRFVDLINAERASAGISQLTVSPQLVEAAQDHAVLMAAQPQIFHNRDLGDGLTGWKRLGENVGRGGGVESLHEALMASDGHRANILNPDFDAIGVGVVWTDGIPNVVQVFMDSYDLPFIDDDSSIHEADIEELYRRGITKGCDVNRYCPERPVTRAEMATMLVRAFDLPSTSAERFTDDDRSPHQAAINALAEAGITAGCGAEAFCPDRSVTRAEMASFLTRALDLPDADPAGFADTSGSVHAAAIDSLAEAGITKGCSASNFCPRATVTRAQMASFIIRAMDH